MSFKATMKKFLAWLKDYFESLPEKRIEADKAAIKRLRLKTQRAKAELVFEKTRSKARKFKETQTKETSLFSGPSLFDR